MWLRWSGGTHSSGLLEFDGIQAELGGDINQGFGDFYIAVVVDADLGDDVTWLAFSDQMISNSHRVCHDFSISLNRMAVRWCLRGERQAIL
jgi:hypothetical protein